VPQAQVLEAASAVLPAATTNAAELVERLLGRPQQVQLAWQQEQELLEQDQPRHRLRPRLQKAEVRAAARLSVCA
jgi:hypothetical protein